MTALAALFRIVIGLFVDDGALALAILAVIIAAGAIARLFPSLPLVAGAVLLFGCLGALLTNAIAAARRRP